MKTKYIYRITNLINGKIYIGQTNNPRERKHSHFKKSSCIPLRNSVEKHGKDNFLFEVIVSIIPVADETEYCKIADETEESFIKEYDCLAVGGKGYNVARGGMTSPKTEEWKKKVVATRRANDSYQMSETTKNALMQANLGKKQSEETIAKRFSEDCKKKMSAAKKGSIQSVESNNKRSKSLTGLKRPLRTDEHRAKLSESRKKNGNFWKKFNFTSEQIEAIKMDTRKIKEIMQQYGCSRTTVYNIKRGEFE